MKICSTCSSKMGKGVPPSDDVKTQWECWCGNVESENFSPEELKQRREKDQEAGGGSK